MQFSIKAKVDNTTDMIFFNKLAEYATVKDINLTIETNGFHNIVTFEGYDLTEILEFVKKQHKELVK